MREEINDWIVQAEADLRKAKVLLGAKEFDGVAFNSHQAVEKILKALFMKRNKRGRAGHSVIYIAKELQVPEDIFLDIKKISPEYLISRYPDIAGVAPVDFYNEETVLNYIRIAEGVLKWAKKQILK